MAERKRILWLIDHLGIGGAERLLVTYLRALDRDLFEPRVCVFKIRDGNPIAKEIKALGIPVDHLPIARLRYPANLPRLLRYLRRSKTELIHTQLEFSNTLGSLAAWLLRIPSVSTLHGVDAPRRGDKAYRRLPLMWWSLRLFCDQVIAVSEATRGHYMHQSGDTDEKIVTAYNGIDLSRFRSLDQSEVVAGRRALGIPADSIILITVSVLRQPKGIQYMIEAMPSIVSSLHNAYYLIVGDGQYGDELRALASRRGLDDHIVFTGHREDIPELLAISDIFALPSLGDALPTVLAEAMASNLPIVATAVGGIPEMVEHQRNGILVEPADSEMLAESCVRLITDPFLAQEMAHEGRKIVEERFNIEKQVKWMSELYLELLSDRGK